MAVYRQIHISFWQDNFVLALTPEEKYFYLYLMTNSKTSQCGIYELPEKIIMLETGYNTETVNKLLNKFIKYGKVEYSRKNQEIFIKNWTKYNFSSSPKVKTRIDSERKSIKTEDFKRKLDTVLIQYGYSMDTETQEEKEEEKEIKPEEENIHTLWMKTFGRNPKIPEIEITERLIKKWGYDHVGRIMKEATLKNFKSILTLENSLDEVGNIKEKSNGKSGMVGASADELTELAANRAIRQQH